MAEHLELTENGILLYILCSELRHTGVYGHSGTEGQSVSEIEYFLCKKNLHEHHINPSVLNAKNDEKIQNPYRCTLSEIKDNIETLLSKKLLYSQTGRNGSRYFLTPQAIDTLLDNKTIVSSAALAQKRALIESCMPSPEELATEHNRREGLKSPELRGLKPHIRTVAAKLAALENMAPLKHTRFSAEEVQSALVAVLGSTNKRIESVMQHLETTARERTR